MNKMRNNTPDIIEMAARWIESAGFRGDLSAFTACFHDFAESIEEVKSRWLPKLLQLDRSERDEALSIIVDLIVELEHLRNHADDALNCLVPVRAFLDDSPISRK